MTVADAGTSSVTVQWTRSRDNVGVSGYGVYLNGRLRGTTSNTQYSLSGLACGTGYTVGVDVFDAAGTVRL